jgi:hypothetical protein
MIRKPLALLMGALVFAGVANSVGRAQEMPKMILLTEGEEQPAAAAPALTDNSCNPCCNPCCETPCCNDKFGLMVGYRTWFSWGNLDDQVGSSLFKFRDTFSAVQEVNFDANWNRLIARLDLGIGGISDGSFRNDTVGAPSGPTVEVEDDDLFYVTADFGYRLIKRGCLTGCNPKGCAVDALIGYQYWEETYEPSLAGVTIFTDEYSWKSIRVGGRAIAARGKLTLQGRVMAVPYTEFKSETDGGFDYVIEANGGWGVFSDLSASYRIWRNLSAEVGYQVFYNQSDNGTIDNSPTFDGAEHVRHGVIVGLNWRF